MENLINSAKRIAESCIRVKEHDEVLVIAENYARPRRFGRAFYEALNRLGTRATLMSMPRRWSESHEPPPPVATAMKGANVILIIAEYYGAFHTTATTEAIKSGVRYFGLIGLTEQDLDREISLNDLQAIKSRTERMSDLLSDGSMCKVQSQKGTNIEFQLAGRLGIAIHPLAGFLLPYYAEAAISPVEETGFGRIVVDGEVVGWGSVLEEAIELTVRNGRIMEVKGGSEEADRIRSILRAYDNADNCPAEFAIGTSHLVAQGLRGSRMDVARCGRIHIAFGRNDGIGGTIKSEIHLDTLILSSTVQIDGKIVVKDGVLVLDGL